MTVGLNERWVHLQNKWIYILHSESWFLNLYPFVFLGIPLVRPDSCPFLWYYSWWEVHVDYYM